MDRRPKSPIQMHGRNSQPRKPPDERVPGTENQRGNEAGSAEQHRQERSKISTMFVGLEPHPLQMLDTPGLSDY